MKAHIYFDLDGTLTAPEEGITRCIRHACATLGHPLPGNENLTWCIGPPLHQNFEALIGKKQVKEGIRLYRDLFSAVGWQENSVYDGVTEALEDLKIAGHTLYVATSKPKIYADKIVNHFGLAPFCNDIFGARLDGTLSDKGALLTFALAQTSAPTPSTSIMVGDRSHDIIGARKNNLYAVGVLYGYGSRKELEQAHADTLIETPDELKSIPKCVI